MPITFATPRFTGPQTFEEMLPDAIYVDREGDLIIKSVRNNGIALPIAIAIHITKSGRVMTEANPSPSLFPVTLYGGDIHNA